MDANRIEKYEALSDDVQVLLEKIDAIRQHVKRDGGAFTCTAHTLRVLVCDMLRSAAAVDKHYEVSHE